MRGADAHAVGIADALTSALCGLQGFEGQYTQRFRELFTNYGFTEYDFIFIDDKAISDTQVRITKDKLLLAMHMCRQARVRLC